MASSNDISASAETACLHVAIGDWQEFLEESRRALVVLEKLDQELDEPEKRADSGIGASSAPTPDDLNIENVNIDDASKEKKKKKKKKKSKKSKTGDGRGDQESEEEDNSTETQSTSQSNCGSDMNPPSTDMSSDAESIRLAEADKLAAQGTQVARSGEPEALKRAIQLLGSAINLYPGRAGYYGNRSLCFFKTGDYISSLEDAEKALQLDAGNLKYLNRKAQALIHSKRQSEARIVAEEMLRISPGNEVAQTILDDIKRQLLEDNMAAMQRAHQDDDLSDDGDTISCAPSSVQFPPVKSSAVKISNLGPNFSCDVLRSSFTSAGIAVTKIEPVNANTAVAFVSNPESARSAVSKLDGCVIENQVVKVQLQK